MKHFLIYLLLIFLLFSTQSIAQISYKVEGIIKQNGKGLSGAIVSVSDFNNDKVKDITSSSTGGFSFSLKADEEYTFLITKPGYITVKLLYSTIGLSEKDKDFKGVSNPEIEIFELPADPGLASKITTLLNKPLKSFYYDADNKKIVDDAGESESMQEDLSKLQKQAAGPKAKEQEAAELELKYKNLITKADNAFTTKNYSNAKDAYNEALTLKSAEQYPKTKLAEIDKINADIIAKEKADKDKLAADAAAKDKAAKDKATTDAAEKDKLAKDKALADATAKEKADKEKAAADAVEKEKADKAKALADVAAKQKADADKAAADAAEQDRIAKAKIAAENAEKDKIAKDKAAAELAEKDRLAKEKTDKEKAIADAAEKERLEKEKAKADEIAKQKAEADKAAAELAEKARLAKEAEAKALLEKYNSNLVKGDSALAIKNYDLAKTFYQNASVLKPKETVPLDKIQAVDKLITAEKQSQYTNELAKKYPQGITEEISKEGNSKITKRIVVQGNKGNLYVKKETSFGTVYYFKDDVTITEAEFIKNTESTK